MTIVWPLRTPTRDRAERLAMTGALTSSLIGTVTPVSVLISGATSRMTSPSGLMCGITSSRMPMSSYVTVLMIPPWSVIREFSMNGTSWPTVMLATWLSEARM